MSIGQGSILVQSKKEAGGGLATADNGLTVGGGVGNVQLGGGLIQETFLGLNSAFKFYITGSDGDNVLLFDEPNGLYFFGFDTAGDGQLVTGWNFDEANQIEGRAAGKVGLRIVESISGLEFYAGDVNGDGNETFLYISDNDKKLEFVTNGNQNGLLIDNQNFIYNFGEFYGAQNGTFIRVNDTNQSIELTQVPSGAVTNDFAVFDGDQVKKIPAPVESGTYTPTLTAGANVSSVSADSVWQYMRVGNVVTVSGTFNIAATAAASTPTLFTFDLPIFSDLSGGNELAGTAWDTEVFKNGAQVLPSSSNTGQVNGYSQSTNNGFGAVHFTYLIVSAP